MVGLGSTNFASAYVPYDCQNGETQYLAYSGNIEPCSKWTGGSQITEVNQAWNSGVTSSVVGSYTSTGSVIPASVGVPWNVGTAITTTTTMAPTPTVAPTTTTATPPASTGAAGASDGYIPNGCKNGETEYLAYSGNVNPCSMWTDGTGGDGGTNAVPAGNETQEPATQSGGVNSTLESIAQCESGGDYSAHNPSSTASGKYQFLDSTWDNYKGYASAAEAPPAIQDERAEIEFANNGTTPWNASKHCWGGKVSV
jgi:hypothetical protein